MTGDRAIYNQDGLQTAHNDEFRDEPRFRAAYARGVQAVGWDYGWHWRVHTALWAARTAVRLPGDFVECGVNHGFMASAIMRDLDWNSLGRRFYLLDTFAGLDLRFVSAEEAADGIAEKNQAMIDSGFYALTVIAFLNSVLGVYYYLRVLVFMYMREPAAGAPVAIPMRSSYVTAALLLSAILVLLLGIMPSQSLDMAIKAAAIFGG